MNDNGDDGRVRFEGLRGFFAEIECDGLDRSELCAALLLEACDGDKRRAMGALLLCPAPPPRPRLVRS